MCYYSRMSGKIFVISAPSGTGKTTIIKMLLDKIPDLVFSVSYTTRQRRSQEKDGVDYRFVSRETFERLACAGKFVEWEEVHGNLYGTAKDDIQKVISSGKDLLLDVDTRGAGNIKKRFPEAILIFLLPPSFDELKKRLKARDGESKEDFERRLKNAEGEYARRHEYDYQIVNDDLKEAFDEIAELVDYYRRGSVE